MFVLIGQAPTYRSQGVNYLGILSKELGDLRGIATLANELIQNADDAKDDFGNFSASRIEFDIRDDALIVSNDAVFRDVDFDRMTQVASGSKRQESGPRTTGAFGVGFISVYQVTDRPEIHSAGQRWVIRPDEPESRRIEMWKDESITADKGTLFWLPWAFQPSTVRRELSSPPINAESLESFTEELKESLPNAILFLKNLKEIALRRNGELVTQVVRRVEGHTTHVDCDGNASQWRIFEGSFVDEAQELIGQFGEYIEENRSSYVKVAIADSEKIDGRLYATLPTNRSTGLPFHIDADFFPTSDRKSIQFEDSLDHKSEWNRKAIHAAAAVLKSNLLSVRDLFQNDAAAFWVILDKLHDVHQQHIRNTRLPLAVFWRTLLPSLKDSPIVLSRSERWLNPSETHMPTSRREESAVTAFEALNFEIVHENLWNKRNILTRNDVGVRLFSIRSIFDALNDAGLTHRPCAIPTVFEDQELLAKLWQGILGAFERTQGREIEDARNLLGMCSLAPGMDGRLWPCGRAYQIDEPSRRVFSPLFPDSFTSLVESGIPLLEETCPKFSVDIATGLLESLNKEILHDHWIRGRYHPSAVLHWFDDRKASMTESTRNRLSKIQMFPSSRGLNSLSELWLPGGFHDPLNVAELLDTSTLGHLVDFLRLLGAKDLTFADYAKRYIGRAFSPGRKERDASKRYLLELLEQRLGEFRSDLELRRSLASADIVECTDGVFRRPNIVYIDSPDVRTLLGNDASYAYIQKQSEGRRYLYTWLGVTTRVRPRDVLAAIERKTEGPPVGEARRGVVHILDSLGTLWPHFGDDERTEFEVLRFRDWLPAEFDLKTWHRPDALYASYNKGLFASQARFLDLPVFRQQVIRDFMIYLNVNRRPEPYRVMNHLLKCSEVNQSPPNGVYRWLNENATAAELSKLKATTCLWIEEENRYRFPTELYWQTHPFGRFRVQLSHQLRSLQNLLQQLGVRDKPDHTDAIGVLKDASQDIGNRILDCKDESVVLECWIMLSEALGRGDVEKGHIRKQLRNVKCVPNKQKVLYTPRLTFIEDRPGLVEKFQSLLEQNCIPRTEVVWQAMEAAGVRNVSEVVKGQLTKPVNSFVDREVTRRVNDRLNLIKTICERSGGKRGNGDGGTDLDSILAQLDFLRAEELMITWRLEKNAFKREWPKGSPEPADAFWDTRGRKLYFTNRNGKGPSWPAISRELSHVVAPDTNIASISPGLKVILESEIDADAIVQLNELGIVSLNELNVVSVPGNVATSFDPEPLPENDLEPQEHGDSPRNGTGPTSPSPGPSELGNEEETESWFAQNLYGVQAINPSDARDNPVMRPPSGPNTRGSAQTHTVQSKDLARQEPYEPVEVTRSELGPEGRALADEFRSMVHSDYGKRCQICSRTFAIGGSDWQVYVVHIVPPRTGARTNHFGDLLGLCGWHYSLMRYGEWALINPSTNRPFNDSEGSEGWRNMRDFISHASEDIDETGNSYVGLTVRFSNVYEEWDAQPQDVETLIRYSIPHWEYLRDLLNS